jgi:hypothetical protein
LYLHSLFAAGLRERSAVSQFDRTGGSTASTRRFPDVLLVYAVISIVDVKLIRSDPPDHGSDPRSRARAGATPRRDRSGVDARVFQERVRDASQGKNFFLSN